jgi:hypothetical protein
MEARDERRLLRLQRDLQQVKLLIIDELGYPTKKTGFSGRGTSRHVICSASVLRRTVRARAVCDDPCAFPRML